MSETVLFPVHGGAAARAIPTLLQSGLSPHCCSQGYPHTAAARAIPTLLQPGLSPHSAAVRAIPTLLQPGLSPHSAAVRAIPTLLQPGLSTHCCSQGYPHTAASRAIPLASRPSHCWVDCELSLSGGQNWESILRHSVTCGAHYNARSRCLGGE